MQWSVIRLYLALIFTGLLHMFIIKCINFQLNPCWLGVYRKGFPTGLYIQSMSPFRFLRKITDEIAFELNIVPSTWYSLNYWWCKLGLVWYSSWPSSLCSILIVLRNSIFPTLSIYSTSTITITKETSDSRYLVMDLFDLHILNLVERFVKYLEDWATSSGLSWFSSSIVHW